MATIWRWPEHFQHDFAARMDWRVADEYSKANHNPIAVLNGDRTKQVLRLPAKPGVTVTLSAEGTHDPDGHDVEVRWWIYPEASSLRDAKGRQFPDEVALSTERGLKTSLVAPPVRKPETIHVVLEVRDTANPPFWSDRRAIIEVQP
jgi:hypothetical protein